MGNEFLLNTRRKVLRKLFRPGTRRRYYYELGLRAIWVIRNEGWRSFFIKGRWWLRVYTSFRVDAVSKILKRQRNFEIYAPSVSKLSSGIIGSRTIKGVVFVPGDEVSQFVFTSCRYRVYNIIEGLASRGIECYVCRERIAERLEELPTPDVAIIFRAALSENMQRIIDEFRLHDVPIVFDCDDLVFEPESANFIYPWKSWTASQRYEYPKSFRDTLDRCDFATCPTDYLASRSRARGKRTFVVPNTINKAQYELAEKLMSRGYAEEKKKIKIGYFSGTVTHDKDFLEAADALYEILERYENTELHIVGAVVLPKGFNRFGSRIVRKPFMPYLDMLDHLSRLDINIAPLEQNNPFTAGKSELKIFEAALVSVPTVASRTDSYGKCITDGKNGFLAGSKEEWVKKLVLLIENKEIRENVGANARKDFIAKFYIENVTDDVIRTYEDIVSSYRKERSIFHPLKLISLREPKALAKKAGDKPAAVAVTLVRNEGDMIAAWMSHICALFDMVYTADHLSTDGTREFLLQMAEARDNIKVFSFDNPGYYQADITNKLAGIAAHEYPDSWIFPLDADEFLSITSRIEFLSHIKDAKSDYLLAFHWKNCVPASLTTDEEFTFASPCLIPPFRGAYKKVAIHSSAFINKSWRFIQGNHGVKDDSGETVSGLTEVDLGELIHIPIRSLDHFALKFIQIYLAYDALPAARKDPRWGFHWRDMIERVLKKGTLSLDVVRDFAAYYGQPSLYSADGVSIDDLLAAGWTRAPLDIAHLEPLPQIRRRYKFLQLAKEFLKEHKNKKLEKFLRVVGTGNPEGETGIAALNSCANASKFGSLAPAFTEDTEFLKSLTETELLSQFLSKAFTPHEDPALSAWEAHIPFLFCLLGFMKPRRFVELGAHYGNCFFAACQASRDMRSAIECIAIDAWQGDKQAGYYGEDVFREFTSILNRKYQNCGKYIRKTFDAACLQFEAGSIDLLHIDGLHTYEAVSHDFNLWLPKMSDRGIIMLHDTQEYGETFGVWKFWQEVKSLYPSFEFEHGHGLGVLLVGNNPTPQVRRLFDIIVRTDYEGLMRFLFSHLGELSPILIGQGSALP